VLRPLVGAILAIIATAGAGVVHGAIVRVKECSATADAFTSAVIVMCIYVFYFGIPASIIGAIFGWMTGKKDKGKTKADDNWPE
jgi:hypothetical protein